MKKNLLFFSLFIFVLAIILSFKSSTKTNLKLQKASSINNMMKAATTNYSYRGIINSTTTCLMSISDNESGTVTITTANGSIQTGDKAVFVLDKTLSFGTYNTFTISANSPRYWLVPFDASFSPIDITNAKTVDDCYKWFCPCDPSKTATNACQGGTELKDGNYIATCTTFNTPTTCSICTPYRMKVECNSGTHLAALDLFNSAFLVRADTLKYNGQTYP